MSISSPALNSREVCADDIATQRLCRKSESLQYFVLSELMLIIQDCRAF